MAINDTNVETFRLLQIVSAFISFIPHSRSSVDVIQFINTIPRPKRFYTLGKGRHGQVVDEIKFQTL